MCTSISPNLWLEIMLPLIEDDIIDVIQIVKSCVRLCFIFNFLLLTICQNPFPCPPHRSCIQPCVVRGAWCVVHWASRRPGNSNLNNDLRCTCPPTGREIAK